MEEIQQTVPNVKTRHLNELRMDVSSRRQQLEETEGRLDQFKFAQQELRISKEAAEELQGGDAELNERISNPDYDIAQMRTSVQRSVTFDLEQIEKVFKDTQTHFGNSNHSQNNAGTLIRFAHWRTWPATLAVCGNRLITSFWYTQTTRFSELPHQYRDLSSNRAKESPIWISVQCAEKKHQSQLGVRSAAA